MKKKLSLGRRLKFAYAAFKHADKVLHGLVLEQKYCGSVKPSTIDNYIHMVKITYIDTDGQEKQRRLSIT